ncbi:MAG: hypothetical protein FJW20_23880 [Acidimicrobiia bacterium]|nr:hypothetical protein [Acidimicrobiia bacterium]
MSQPAKPIHLRSPGDDLLESWKQIAGYLRRDVRTVQRWERLEGLPIHRHLHSKISSVHAFKSEIDAWCLQRGSRPLPPPAPRRSRLIFGAVAVFAALAGALVLPRLWKPTSPSDVLARRVWQGPGVHRFGSISPDGLRLAYEDSETQDLAVLHVPSGKSARLTHKPPKARIGSAHNPVFSPDGRWIAYLWDLAGPSELRITARDGASTRVLASFPSWVRLFDWSPDGKHLLAMLPQRPGYQLVSIDAASGQLQVWKQWNGLAIRNACFLPNRPALTAVYDLPKSLSMDQADIVLHSLSPIASQSTLVSHEGADALLGCTPDGRILYACDRTGSLDAWILHPAETAASRDRLVLKQIGWVWPSKFSRSGTFFYGQTQSTTDVYMAALDLDGIITQQPRSVTGRDLGANRFPDWSPTGDSFLFASFAGSNSTHPTTRVFARSLSLGPRRSILVSLLHPETIRWDTDGRSLLVSATHPVSGNGLYRVDLAGQISPLSMPAKDSQIVLDGTAGAAGQLLYYRIRQAGVEPGSLFLKKLPSGPQRLISSSVYRYSLAPSGRIAYSTFDDNNEYIRVIPALGKPPVQIHSEPRQGRIVSVAWTRDESAILYAKKGSLWMIPASGGAVKQLSLQMEGLRDLRVNPSSDHILFTAGSSDHGELWALENILPPTR